MKIDSINYLQKTSSRLSSEVFFKINTKKKIPKK
jgi:hypothetical protein